MQALVYDKVETPGYRDVSDAAPKPDQQTRGALPEQLIGQRDQHGGGQERHWGLPCMTRLARLPCMTRLARLRCMARLACLRCLTHLAFLRCDRFGRGRGHIRRVGAICQPPAVFGQR